MSRIRTTVQTAPARRALSRGLLLDCSNLAPSHRRIRLAKDGGTAFVLLRLSSTLNQAVVKEAFLHIAKNKIAWPPT